MIGNAPRQLDRRRVGQRAGRDLGQREAGMLGREDQVAGQRQLEAAADRHAVDGGDHRLVEVGQLLQPAEAADAVVAVTGVRRRPPPSGPSRRRRTSRPAADDGDAQLRIVAEAGECLAQRAAGGAVDGVGLRPVEHDLQDGAVARWHGLTSLIAFAPRIRIRTSAATAPARGPDDQRVDVQLDQPVAMGRGEPRYSQHGVDRGVEVAGEAGRGSPAAAVPPSDPSSAGRTSAAGRRQQQSDRSASSSTSTPPAPEHEVQADLRVADDADDQLGHAVVDHRLDQHRLAQTRHAGRPQRTAPASRRPRATAPSSLLCASAWPTALTTTG